ncbi:MAG TPA: hypothetical protein VD788_14035 [Candidatus Polarisedimenticolaceae bacterium]|nr:hypothetical protein [Candidatus Polarisedimenticolaceae bacterium]
MRAARPLSVLIALLAAGGVAAEHGDHGAHAQKGDHEVALFLGVTDDRGMDAFTWGLEYPYQFTDRVAGGAFFDKTEGDLRMSVLGGAFYYKPLPRLALMIGPAVERLEPMPDGGHGENAETETELLLRVGVLYGFPVAARVSILPALYADFVDGETVWVGGADVAFSF